MRRSANRRKRHELAASGTRPAWFTHKQEDSIDTAELDEALRALSDEHREVIVAKIWGGLSFEQIAEVVGTSRSSAHRRYEAGLIILRHRLEPTWLNEKPTKDSMNLNAS
jgi:RNA polymerase sigma-70 factor (ECF subfamily)